MSPSLEADIKAGRRSRGVWCGSEVGHCVTFGFALPAVEGQA